MEITINTKIRYNATQEDPFNAWIRNQVELDSYKGFRAYDTDLNFWHKETLAFGHMETKTRSSMPPPDQVITMQMTRVAFETANTSSIKQMLATHMGHKKDNFDSQQFRYSGYFLLQYENTDLNDGSASLYKLTNQGFSKPLTIDEGDNQKLVDICKWMMNKK